MLDFTIFLENNLRIIPIWPSNYNPEEDISTCLCPRKSYCPNPGKHPMFKEWYNSPPPENTEEIKTQIQNSKCNFAIVTGILPNDPTQQLIIIDVDLPAMHLEEIKEFPPTLTIATPSGGLHFYYIVPSSIKIPNLSTGYVDIRAYHGYALCPPSSHYRFVPTSLSTITHLTTLPNIPSNPSNSSRNGSSTHPGINHPNDYEITSEGLVACGGRDAYVFSTLITLVNAGHDLNSLLEHVPQIHASLEQPPKDPYTLTAITEKAHYVYNRYHDSETEALRKAMDETYPPA